MVCENRSDLYNDNLHETERLILSHISWRVSLIAEEDTIKTWVANAHEEAGAAQQRYSKYLPCFTLDSEDGDDEYTHGDITKRILIHFFSIQVSPHGELRFCWQSYCQFELGVVRMELNSVNLIMRELVAHLFV